MVAGGEQSGLRDPHRARAAVDVQPVLRAAVARGLDPRRPADRGGRAERAAAPARQHPVHRPAPEDEHGPRPAQRPVDPVPRRADAGPRRRRGARRSASSSSTGRRPCPGRTVLLTTHYMAEADELCERIAIVDRGRILAIGTPDELKRRVQRESIFRLELDRLDGGVAQLARLPGVESAALAADTDPESQRVAVNLVLTEDARARRRRHRAGRHGVAHPRPPQVGADARGRVRRARRARLRRRGGPRQQRTARATATATERTPSRSPTSRTRRPTSRRRSPDGARPAPPTRCSPPPATAATPGPRPTGRSARSSRATPGRWSGAPTRASGAWSASRQLAVLRDPAAVPDDRGVRPRLPRAPGARGVRRVRRAGRGDGRVLAQRRVDDGEPAVLGEEPGQPRALLRGAHEPDGDPARAWRSAGS